MKVHRSPKTGNLPRIWNRILPYSAAAPSPLNSQPWSFRFRGPLTLELCLDPRRLLPWTDPTFRQAYLSAGAFIENLEIAAREAGFRAEISLFPSGWPDASHNPDQPVAGIELAAGCDIPHDPLFCWLLLRHTNRKIYTADKILPETFSILALSFDQQFTSFGFSADSSFGKDLAGYLKRASEIELSDPDRLSEYLSYVRVTGHRNEHQEVGYGGPALGLTRIAGWVSRLRIRMCRAGSGDRCAGDLLIRLTQKQAESAAAFGWIVTKGNSRHDQVRAGRAYERVHLAAASVGLSLQPMTAILTPYPEMQEMEQKVRDLIGIPDTHTLQMLFRLGYSAPAAPTGRRPLKNSSVTQ